MFLRHSILLILGTGAAQAIPFLMQPILRRMYTPEEFGAFAIFFSLICILTVIATFRLDLAITLPAADQDAARLLVMAVIFNLGFNLMLFVAILTFKTRIALLFHFPPNYSNFLFLLPLSTFFFCTAQAIGYWLIRKKAFGSISANKIARRGTEGMVQAGFGLFRSSSGLFWADVSGNLVNCLSGIRQLRRTGFRIPSIAKAEMKAVLLRYINFPKYNLVPSLLGTIAMQFPVFAINRLFTRTELGFYDLTQQAIMAPFVLITVAVSQVFLQSVSEKRQKQERISGDFISLSLILLAIGVVSLGVIELWGQPLFRLVFGMKWSAAGSYARILIIGYVVYLVSAPMTAILQGLERIRLISLWNLLHVLIMGSLFLVKSTDFITFLWIFTGLESLVFGLLFVFVFGAVRKYEKSLELSISN